MLIFVKQNLAMISTKKARMDRASPNPRIKNANIMSRRKKLYKNHNNKIFMSYTRWKGEPMDVQ